MHLNEIKKGKQKAILLTVLVMTFMVTLDSSIVNVALPTMAKQLHTSMGGIEWTATGYLVVMCAFVLLFGKLGDMMGKAVVFQIGGLVFTIGSLLCSISPSLGILIAARVVQGMGAAAALSCNQGIITEIFPKAERGKALGTISTAVALGTMIGPIAGGAIVSFASWEYIFVINIPIGFLAFFAGYRTLPKHEKKIKVKLDKAGSILSTLSIISIVCAITLLQAQKSIYLYGLLGFGIVLFIMFLYVEQKQAHPLIPLGIFKGRLFSVNLICMFLSFVGIGAVNIIMPFYLQDAKAYTAGVAGIILTIIPITLAIFGPFSGAYSDKKGCKGILCVGMFLYGIGVLLQCLFLGLSTPLAVIVILLGIFSCGAAISQPPNNSLLMSSVKHEYYGFAGAIGALMRNLGITLGLTLATTILYGRMSAKVGHIVTGFLPQQPEAFIYGMQWVFACLAILLFIGAIMMFIEYRKDKNTLRNDICEDVAS